MGWDGWCLGCSVFGVHLGCSVFGMSVFGVAVFGIIHVQDGSIWDGRVWDGSVWDISCLGWQGLGCTQAMQQMEAVGWQMASPSSGSSGMLSAGCSSRVPLQSSAQNSGAGNELIPILMGRWEPDLFLAWLWERSLQGVWISRLLWS